MVAAFTTQFSLGSLVAIMAVFGGVITIGRGMRGTWHENYEAEKVARIAAEADAKEVRERKEVLKSELAAARLATDLTAHQRFMVETLKTMTEASQSYVTEAVRESERRMLEALANVLETQRELSATQVRQTRVLEALEIRLNGYGK